MDATNEIIRHNSWATVRLIEHLTSMPQATLELSAPGTYGPIGATLAHLLRAERAYLAHVKGETPTPEQRDLHVDLAQLADQARSLGEQWEYLVQVGINPHLEAETLHGLQTASSLLAQVVNHATEHRAHVCTVLGAHGMKPPALDAFSYRAAVRDGL
jgi:uncharacterized damage-inducible protein DinB